MKKNEIQNKNLNPIDSKPFNVVSSYNPSGDQPDAIKKL